MSCARDVVRTLPTVADALRTLPELARTGEMIEFLELLSPGAKLIIVKESELKWAEEQVRAARELFPDSAVRDKLDSIDYQLRVMRSLPCSI